MSTLAFKRTPLLTGAEPEVLAFIGNDPTFIEPSSPMAESARELHRRGLLDEHPDSANTYQRNSMGDLVLRAWRRVTRSSTSETAGAS